MTCRGFYRIFPLPNKNCWKLNLSFYKIAGKKDLPTERLLEYIDNNSRPRKSFNKVGMKIWDSAKESRGIHLLSLSSELLKAIEPDFFQALLVDTSWERKFKLLWCKENDRVIRLQDSPDGIYFIDEGSVRVLDKNERLITTLTAGDIFGEMAYLSKKWCKNSQRHCQQ